MCHILRPKISSPAFLGVLFCLISALVEFSLRIKTKKAMTKCRICKIHSFITMIGSGWDQPSSSSKPPRIQFSFAFLDALKVLRVSYLKQLHPNTSKHELQQSCNNHDITNSSNSHKDTLNNVLERRKKNVSMQFVTD